MSIYWHTSHSFNKLLLPSEGEGDAREESYASSEKNTTLENEKKTCTLKNKMIKKTPYTNYKVLLEKKV